MEANFLWKNFKILINFIKGFQSGNTKNIIQVSSNLCKVV